MSNPKCVFKGTFLSAISMNNLDILRGFICVENGLITLTGSADRFNELEKLRYFEDYNITCLSEHEIMVPGFVDCHTHAPQFPNLGLGLDRPLLEWLDKYTFPLEKMYNDVEFASTVYDKVVQSLLCNGTTTACYFGSLHLEGTMQLIKAVLKHHQRALVGKVSMNIKNDVGYYNETKKELNQAEEFVKRVQALGNSLVEPVITPRFAVSCNEELMMGLATIAARYGCRIQSHISENRKEIEHVLNTFPGSKNYSEVYDKSGILNRRCIMAHAVHLDSEEMKLLASRGVSVAHCPASNTRLRSGLCPVRDLLDHNLTVGLGTDVSGGDSASIMDAMRRAMDVSTHLDLLSEKHGETLNWKAAFYLATMGGAKALNLDDKIGNFKIGKEFDALRIDVYAPGSPIVDYRYSVDTSWDEIASSLLQRFVHTGDNRNIREVYVRGRRVETVNPYRNLSVN